MFVLAPLKDPSLSYTALLTFIGAALRQLNDSEMSITFSANQDIHQVTDRRSAGVAEFRRVGSRFGLIFMSTPEKGRRSV